MHGFDIFCHHNGFVVLGPWHPSKKGVPGCVAMCVDVISVYSLMSFRCIPVQHGTHTKSVYSLIKIYLSIYLIGVLLLWRG